MRCAFGDPDDVGDVAHPGPRIARDREQHRVVVVTFAPPQLLATSQPEGARTVVRFDCAGEAPARAEIEIALDRGAGQLILDLRRLTFLDPRGLHVLLDTRSAARAQQQRVLLVPAPDHVQRILAVCGVERDFELLDRHRDH